MILFVLAYLGGVLTIVSPCILPVLPFVFARADRPFTRSGLPLLVGMAATFALVATLAAVGGGWAVSANQYGRGVALALLALFGITLLFPAVADRVMQPAVSLGARLSRAAVGGGPEFSIGSSLLLGVATGLLWAPCAGPVLGLILTGAALQGASARTTFLLLAFAAGSATSLALALLIGGRVFAALKQSLGLGEWIRRAAGIAILGAVAAIALGVDTGFLTRVSLSGTSALEQRLLNALHPASSATAPPSAVTTEVLADEGILPPLAGSVEWLNSPPLTTDSLRGKVVLVDFWTYSCINCLRAIPYVRAWAEKYAAQGLVVIGVHTPEFAFEKSVGNVRKAVADLEIGYPVAIDNDYAVWRAFKNEYWPAHYFIDATGRIRHHHFGEGDYGGSERVIQQLLKEAGIDMSHHDFVSVRATGAEAAPDLEDALSPETYVGYGRAEHFVSSGGAVRDRRHSYATGTPRLNEWGLSGVWTIREEDARLDEKDGRLVYRFHARDLHLVLGPAAAGTSVRFRITIDGAAPGENHGTDVDAEGRGIVTEQRLYQLVRQAGTITDRTFEIRFLDPGVQVYAFTFG
ncbi:MAG TPA: cytochrome c biogenesis protein DipZ [Vicinamibacterales bacterium]|jgi:cytochrome c biogenesis protein CcdA/thiol-disulfide isomerase/thioredoxin|nr:cytochrome c biogenesis protein DipZ [Vicinamibacterales bacterium]